MNVNMNMKKKVLGRGFTQSLKLALGRLSFVRAGMRDFSENIRDSFRISPRPLGARASSSAGFTLIELLVVIAIIGLLAAVVLASLNTARAKGADAAIKADLRNIQSQAALIYDNNTPNGYTGAGTNNLCSGVAGTQDPTTANALLHAQNAGGATSISYSTTGGPVGGPVIVSCHSTLAAYAISAPLKTLSGAAVQYWCVDSTGKTGASTTAIPANQVTCP